MRCVVDQEDRIVSERFERLCDFSYTPGSQLPENEVCLVYCKTDYVASFLDACARNLSTTKYILVTHQSDYGITKNLISKLPDNVVKWFGQNVECVDDPRVESIPIGSASLTWIGKKQYAEVTHAPDFDLIEETGKAKVIQNLAYMNFAIHTNPDRRHVYDFFKNQDWVTACPADLSLEEYKKTRYYNNVKNDYMDLYNHKFCIAPLGNGVDCGRTWQAIYLNTIPIIPRHLNIEFYRDLPILVYDDIEEITEPYLNYIYTEYSQKTFNYDKAKISYWKNRFLQEKEIWVS
tara:strand:- start:5493 stop:6365 length:873 start_codon:yes stop_codon:yes gene_type:complete